MRHDQPMMQVGKRGDPFRFGEAADTRQVRLQNVDLRPLDQIAEFLSTVFISPSARQIVVLRERRV